MAKRLPAFFKKLPLLRLLLAVVGGVCSSLAMPREGIWPLIFVSVALLLASIYRQKFSTALFIGFVGGLSFYLSQIEWLSLYLGPVPWLALSVLEAAIFAIGMATTAAVWAWLDQKLPKTWAGASLTALTIAIIWTSREWVSITLPYGGFPWSRLAQTQSESILAKWVYLGGLGWLTFLVAALSALLVITAISFFKHGFRIKHLALPAVSYALIFAIPALMFIPSNAEAGTLTVGSVQGNANAGLFSNEVRGTILNNHLSASKLLQSLPLRSSMDVVVWPENASDISPLSDIGAAAKITDFVDNKIKVPLILGAISSRGEELYNSSVLWEPGVGPTDWYDKKRPVPFAEYVPDRDFWYQLAPDLIGLVSRGYNFGTRDGIFSIQNKADAGVLICFEIAIDDIGRDLVSEGAQVIFSQTNNADFGHSDETYQQGAFAKLRAIETGRAIVNISTVGLSMVYAPDGTKLDSLPVFEPGAMITQVPLRTSKTPAMIIGSSVDLFFNLAAALITMIVLMTWLRGRKQGSGR
jgi:apolipoprotein N-acyltransferase